MSKEIELNASIESEALLTDFYQLTMAYGFWQAGMDNKEAVFHLFYRRAPFNGGYCIACGLENVIEFVERFRFEQSDLDYLASITGNDGKPLFKKEFLVYLKGVKFSCNIDAVPEGSVVFPFEPIIRVQGPIVQCQILETPLLNMINFQSLVATKAARICRAAQGDPVMEFGLRRAQGINGALTASRASYIGGCDSTSNVLAGKKYGIPVKGTMAHSWVMAFDNELKAFDTYAEIMPNNSVLLVDTYSTLNGVKNAIKVGERLRERGYELGGIRLDSGDLAYLSIEARKILNENGFESVKILASNDLDETIIQSLKVQKAQIDIWGIGTKLVTAYDQPALDGVYKLSAIRNPNGVWKYKIKISEQSAKVTTPGIQQVRRYYRNDLFIGDVIYDNSTDLSNGCVMVDPFDITRQKSFTGETKYMDLLVPIFKNGMKVMDQPKIEEIKQHTKEEISRFHTAIMRLVNPHQYPVGHEKSLNKLKTKLTVQARRKIL